MTARVPYEVIRASQADPAYGVAGEVRRVLAAGMTEFTLPAGVHPSRVRVRYFLAPVPRALIGGSYARCPEHGCSWRRRLARRGLARYRRHWSRRHAR